MIDLFGAGRKVPRAVALFLLALICVSALCSCAYTVPLEEQGQRVDFLSLELSELERYIEIGQYKDLTITNGSKTKGVAVWEAVIDGCDVKDYPQEHIYYYVDQIKEQYLHYAESADMSYAELAKELGISDGSILMEAREMTKTDIVCAIIQKREGIMLSDDEKQVHFERYVEKYVSEYGYSADYVREHMLSEIYDSMLYDKTTEFLILNNSFN